MEDRNTSEGTSSNLKNISNLVMEEILGYVSKGVHWTEVVENAPTTGLEYFARRIGPESVISTLPRRVPEQPNSVNMQGVWRNNHGIIGKEEKIISIGSPDFLNQIPDAYVDVNCGCSFNLENFDPERVSQCQTWINLLPYSPVFIFAHSDRCGDVVREVIANSIIEDTEGRKYSRLGSESDYNTIQEISSEFLAKDAEEKAEHMRNVLAKPWGIPEGLERRFHFIPVGGYRE